MSYKVFKARVRALIKRSKSGVKVAFSHDNEKGQHIAQCSDGTTIFANSRSYKVSVHWGAGHQGIVSI